MLTDTIAALLSRDLGKVKTEIESYKNEATLWMTDKEIANPAGNLCLHLIGNLNTYIGAVLGNTGYERNRGLEFSLKNIPRKELVEKIEATITMVNSLLPTITDEQLNSEYPLVVFSDKMTTGYFLVHLTAHLSYHLGQINYHRRMLDFL